jgi:hypothetical protein
MKNNFRKLQLCRETLHFLTRGDSELRSESHGLLYNLRQCG